MKMAVSGRTRDKWWPPDEAKPFTPKKREFVNESSLIIMRGQVWCCCHTHGTWHVICGFYAVHVYAVG